MKINLPLSCSAGLALIITPASALAAAASAPLSADDDGVDIIVTAPRLAGSVNVDIPADIVLDAAAVESYGVSSVTDLLGALSAQTRSGRGRGEGRPVVLLNGKRISGFAEIRDLPSEAIQRVEVLPEEAALRYGFSADQRVINFILKPGFSAITLEGEVGGPTAGGRTDAAVETSLVRIEDKGRINIDAEYDRYGAILEKERKIQPEGVDQTAYRTLAPANEALKLNAVLNRTFGSGTGATLSVQHNRADAQSLLGLAAGAGPATPIVRDADTRSWTAGLTLDGRLSRFNWTATASGERTVLLTLTDAQDPAVATRNRARSRLMVGTGTLSLTGPAFELPAGPATINMTLGAETRDIESLSERAAVSTRSQITRDDVNGRANLDLPLTSRRRAVGAAIGDLSINLNGGYQHLSDFGAITAYGYGVTWSPLRGVTLLGSFAAAEAAPTASQLGESMLITPNALVFDYVRGTSALVTLISGGNGALVAEKRRDTKLGLTYEPQWVSGMTLTANYFRNRSTNPISAFPALTAVTELAFPDRFRRDVTGALISVDQRPVNFLAARSTQLKWGMNYQKQIGQSASGGGPAAGGRGFGGFGRGQGGRWSVSLYHTVKFQDEVDLAGSVPQLDLLGGDATGQSGGSPRHVVDLEGGWFNKGVGFRVNGSHQSATTVRLAGQGNSLNFSDLTTLNLRFFLNFDQKKQILAAIPALKGTRLALRIDNVLNDIQDVRDQTGLVPVRYQPGYLDPVGRRVEISLRKIF
ncbi:MAG: hypothetical protein RJB22_527 [Pseudomonadota bacterium]